MSATAPETTSREYRDKVRKLARVICAAGYDAMRRNYHIVQAARHFNKFYSVDFFEPYEFQHKWLQSGSRFRLRMLSAANRIGKTRTGAVEFSYHSTGRYPAWWRGYCVTNELIGADRVLWAVGVSTDSTRKVLQKELLGTADARQKFLIGSGTIPRECINFESFICDGETVKSFRTFHTSGEESENHFYSSTQDEHVRFVFFGQMLGIIPCSILEIDFPGLVFTASFVKRGYAYFWCCRDSSNTARGGCARRALSNQLIFFF